MKKRKINPFSIWDFIPLSLIVLLVAVGADDWESRLIITSVLLLSYLFFRKGFPWLLNKQPWVYDLVLIGSLLWLIRIYFYDETLGFNLKVLIWPWWRFEFGVVFISWLLGFYRRKRFDHKDSWAKFWLILAVATILFRKIIFGTLQNIEDIVFFTVRNGPAWFFWKGN